MSKGKGVFFCMSCGNEFSRWSGQCSACLEWNSIAEEPKEPKKSNNKTNQTSIRKRSVDKPVTVDQINLAQIPRISTQISEFDNILGGGVTSGSVILIGGDPGVGKSTLLTQVIALISQKEKVLYISGEESLSQISQRCQRLDVKQDKLWLFASTNIDDILEIAEENKPKIMVIDSIQTVYNDNISSATGSITQVRECCSQLINYAKTNECAVFIIGHVTKDGNIAGPRVLEHMVDTVLYLEGEKEPRYRMLRAIKNRFGSVNELAVFAMTSKGMKQVKNPSAIFLASRDVDVSGSTTTATKEGSRAMLIEIQALTDYSNVGNSRRLAVGMDFNRLSMLLAILNRHIGISTFDQDFYINIVGGVRIQETSSDLAVILAVISSYKNQPLAKDLIVFGELGLTGEIRPVADGESRMIEASKQGFKTAIIPYANIPKDSKNLKIKVIGVKFLKDAVTAAGL